MSTLRQKQDAAIAVFRELGWADADRLAAASLSLGTQEQRRVAKEGLERGDWEDYLPGPRGEDEDEDGEWGNLWGLDSPMLRLFAIRVGVSVRRAVQVFQAHSHSVLDPTDEGPEVLAILLERGPAFATAFFTEIARQGDFSWWDVTDVALSAVLQHGVPEPDAPQYLQSFAERLAHAFEQEDKGWDPDPNERLALPSEVFRERFLDHAQRGLPAAAADSQEWASALAGALARGWVTREQALELIWVGMDAAQRPAARAPWPKLLAGAVAVTEQELGAARDRLVPLLSLGHGPTVEFIAPRLIAQGSDADALEVAYAALGAGTQKAKVAVLKALASRPAPAGEDREELLGVVGQALQGTPTEAKAARAVLDTWGAEAADEAEELPPARGLWRARPPVWSVPRFEVGEATVEAIRTAEVLRGPGSFGEALEDERALALVNAFAFEDSEAAEALLQERRTYASYAEIETQLWAAAPHADVIRAEWAGDRKGPPATQADIDEASGRTESNGWCRLTERRTDSVARWLGSTPTLLSTPSRQDLTVEVDVLLDRLERLRALDVPALEDDLFLALTRLRGTADGSLRLDAELTARLEQVSTVPVRRWNGKLRKLGAGALVGAYVADPVRSPRPGGAVLPPGGFAGRLSQTDGVAGFATRLRHGGSMAHEGLAVFPEWDDEALGTEAGQQPVFWRQVARRSRPLSPALASNLVWAVACRPQDATLREALSLSWARGLISPEALDPGFFGFAAERGHLDGVALAALLLAEEGGASASWALLTRVVDGAASAQRTPAKLVAVIEALGELLPEAVEAVDSGLVPNEVLELHGLRALAARTGSSAVVGAARKVAGLLPGVLTPIDGTDERPGAVHGALPTRQHRPRSNPSQPRPLPASGGRR